MDWPGLSVEETGGPRRRYGAGAGVVMWAALLVVGTQLIDG